MDCFASLAMTKCEGPVVVAMARLLLLMARHAACYRARSLSACRIRSAPRQLFRAHLRDVVVVELPGGILAPAQRRLHRGARAGGRLQETQRQLERQRLRLRIVRPAGRITSGKSENRKRGTAACSTMSLAQPITTVEMPLASRWRANQAGGLVANRAVRHQHGDIDLVGEATGQDFRGIDVDRHPVAAIGRRAEKARRDLADPPRGFSLQQLRQRKPAAVSVAEVCLRS